VLATTDRTQAVQWHERLADVGVEGLAIKPLVAPYRAGRASGWLKVRHTTATDAVVLTAAPGPRPATARVRLTDGGEVVLADVPEPLRGQLAAALARTPAGLQVEVRRDTGRHAAVRLTRIRAESPDGRSGHIADSVRPQRSHAITGHDLSRERAVVHVEALIVGLAADPHDLCPVLLGPVLNVRAELVLDVSRISEGNKVLLFRRRHLPQLIVTLGALGHNDDVTTKGIRLISHGHTPPAVEITDLICLRADLVERPPHEIVVKDAIP
jgi:hypothetical protein